MASFDVPTPKGDSRQPDGSGDPVRRPRPLGFYWAFGALWVLIGIADLFAQSKNLLGLGPVAIGLAIWIIGVVSAVRRRRP